MNEPHAPPQPDAAASPRAIGGYRLFDRLDVREVGTLQLAQKEGGHPVLLWWVDSAAIPEIAATWADVVRAMRAVASSNVLAIRDDGEQSSIRWMTFPYVAAETLAGVLLRLHSSRTPLPWELACRIVIDAARGIDALHACRDGERTPWPMHGALSGESFSIAFDGRTFLLDPGHLFPLQAQSEEALPYSAPERVWSEPSDAHADVFSLGVLLWELCSGRRLFRGRDDDETRALLEAHVVPELALRVRGTPAKLDALVARALARTTAERIASASELVRELETLFEVGGATTAEVAKYMRTHFADRERAQRARIEAATEVTEIRVPAQRNSAAVLAIALEEATLTHQISAPTPTPTPTTGSNTTVPGLNATGAASQGQLEDPTVPRLAVRQLLDAPEAPRIKQSDDEETTNNTRLNDTSEGTGETRQISFDAKTRALPIADTALSRASVTVDDVDAQTLPRISNIDAQLAVVLESDELMSVSDVIEPPTRRRDDAENTNTEIETHARLPGPRARTPHPVTSSLPVLSPAPRREEVTPTRVRAETRPRRGGMDVNRPPPAAGRPPTPGEPMRVNSSLPPARAPRRAPEGAMASRRPEVDGEGISVRPPPPAPPPPRPPPKTPPPPVAAFVPIPSPPPPPRTAAAAYVGAGPAPAAAFAGAQSFAQQPGFAQAGFPQPGAPQLGFAPHVLQPQGLQQPMLQAPGFRQPGMQPGFQQAGMQQPVVQQGFQQPGFRPQGFQQPGFPQPGQPGFPQPGFPQAAVAMQLQQAPAVSNEDSTSDSSVSFGPSVPIPSTVIDEPAEKVIVAPGAAGGPTAPGAPTSVRGAEGAAPVSGPPSASGEASAREPLLLPRDPHMPAMQRALLAREAVRESDRRIALPVVVVAFVVAVGVAIGIPLLARRPGRVVNVTPASASGDPSASAPSGTLAPPPLPTNAIPTTTLGTAPGTMPPLTGPVLGTSPPPSTERAPDRTPTPTARAPRPTPKPAARRPEPRPKPEPRDDEPIPREPAPREKELAASAGTTTGGKGLLTVICLPACDDVLDGTRSLGASPVFRASVSAGTHRLTLRIADPPTEKVVSITVSPDEITVLKQPMSK